MTSYMDGDLLVIDDGNQFEASELIDRYASLASDPSSMQPDIDQNEMLRKNTREYSTKHKALLAYCKTVLGSPLSGIIVKGLIQNPIPPHISKLVFLTVMLGLGKPVHHQKNIRSLVWDIKLRQGEGFTTFSEHNSEAPLHTDSQYNHQPEKYIALYVQHQARCGGGKSRILNGGRLFSDLMSTTDGTRLVELLSREKVPFLIPTVFTKNQSVNYVYAPIFAQKIFLRYRKDTLMKGFEFHGERFSSKIVNAVLEFDNFIENSPHINQVMLDDGDLLISNNHLALHARTSFSDEQRWLFRVRFN